MSFWEALILGIVQGLTEPLPVSSSGHLIIVPWLGDFTYLQQHPDFNKTFDVALHLGTLVGVVAYFRHEVAQIVRGSLRLARRRRVENDDDRLALLMIIGTIPAVVVGSLGEDAIDEHFGEPWQIAILLAVFGLALAWADRIGGEEPLDRVGPRDAGLIGMAQAVALLPGVSRSGVTITAGRLLGFSRDASARFAFLLLIPAVTGAVVYKGGQVAVEGLPAGSIGPMAVGILAAAVSGYGAIWGLLKLIRRHTYDGFVIYRLVLAFAILAIIASGFRPPDF